MNYLYKYYRWRARKAKKDASVIKFRLKAYKILSKSSTFGYDLTGLPYEEAQKLRYPDEPKSKVGRVGDWPHEPGRYLDGPFDTLVWDEESGRNIDPNDWKETPQWWADEPEANQQHHPTKLTKSRHIIGWTLNKETGRREYITYNYKTGKQEDIK